MTKNDVKRLRGLLTVAAGSIAAVKGDFQTRDRMNTSRMRSLMNHWQDAGREMLEILAHEDLQQPDTREDERPIMLDLDDPDSLLRGRITIDPATVPLNGASEEVNENT
jgi:hypothetical protein